MQLRLLSVSVLWLSTVTLFKSVSSEGISLSLYSYRDIAYLIDVSIGTPAQHFRPAVIVGSGSLGIADAVCEECCHKDVFHRNSSTTFSLSNPAGSPVGVDGIYTVQANDSVVWGTNTSKPFIFGDIVSADASSAFAQTPLDGFVDPNVIDQGAFTIYAKKVCASNFSSQTENAGVLSIGSEDTINCNIVTYFPMTTTKKENGKVYQVNLSSATLGSKSFSTPAMATLTTANENILVPKSFFAEIQQLTNATKDTNGDYTLACTITPGALKLVITAGTAAWEIPSSQFITHIGATCYLNIKPSTDDQWTLGMPLHRQFCTKYDEGTTQFGLATHRTADSTTPCTYQPVPVLNACPMSMPENSTTSGGVGDQSSFTVLSVFSVLYLFVRLV